VDAPALFVDPEARELVVPEPALPIAADAFTAFDGAHPPRGRELAPVTPGRYPLASWVFVTVEETTAAVGRAQAVAAAAAQIANAAVVGPQQALDRLHALLARVAARAVPWQEPAPLAAELVGIATK